MRRRDIITLVGGAALAWPLSARAQQGGRPRNLAVLVHGLQTDQEWQRRVAAFRQELEQIGWQEQRNIHIEWRYTGNDFDRLAALAKEVVALNPDVIFTNTTPATKALQQQTQSIPIVFVQVSDPAGSGIVTNLARPGGNITGFLFYENSIAGKWLGMLKEISPHLTRVGVVGTPKGFAYNYVLRAADSFAGLMSVEVVAVPVENVAAIEPAIRSFARVPNGGLLFPPDNLTEQHRDLVISLAAQSRLPAVYSYRDFVTAGGLMYYGTDLVAQFRQAASYIDRILRGARPADLPVQAPIKFETVVSLKTAKALGFEVSSTLLVRADEVIE